MDVIVTTPEYSFLSLGDPVEYPDGFHVKEPPIPVFNLKELVFQVIFTGTSAGAQMDTFVIKINGFNIGQLKRFNTADPNIVIGIPDWSDGTFIGDVVADGECFQIDLYGNFGSGVGTITFNETFKFIDDTRYTTLLRYYNRNDAYGFFYYEPIDGDPQIISQVRLPMTMRYPDYPTTSKVYRKSTGQFKRLSTIISKNYEIETDLISERMFDALTVALQHDNIYMVDEQGQSNYVFAPEKQSIKQNRVKISYLQRSSLT